VARWYEEVVPHCGKFYCSKKVVRQDDDFLLKIVPRVTTSLATFAKKSCHVTATSLVEITQKSPLCGTTSMRLYSMQIPYCVHFRCMLPTHIVFTFGILVHLNIFFSSSPFHIKPFLLNYFLNHNELFSWCWEFYNV